MAIGKTRVHKGQSQLEFPDAYVVIDIETTGFDPWVDEIIELSGICYADGEEIARFQTLVKPQRRIDAFVTELTGITNEMVSDAPKIAEALPCFLAFIGGNIIVGHNVNYDINFLYDEAERQGLPPLSNDYVDTLRISRLLYPDFPNHKLETLVERLGVGEKVKHRALSDCQQTSACLSVMRGVAEQNGGLARIRAARRTPKLKAEDIVTGEIDIDPDGPIFERVFVFTGKLEKMLRRDAMQAVVNHGGICGDGVNASTNYLVLGNNDYCSTIKDGKSAKQKKAERMRLSGSDIEIISENVFYDMLGI